MLTGLLTAVNARRRSAALDAALRSGAPLPASRTDEVVLAAVVLAAVLVLVLVLRV